MPKCECGQPACKDFTPCDPHCFCLVNEAWARFMGQPPENECCRCGANLANVLLGFAR